MHNEISYVAASVYGNQKCTLLFVLDGSPNRDVGAAAGGSDDSDWVSRRDREPVGFADALKLPSVQ